jgi:DNA-directed RNA polymerase specialized sigma24 family protein
MTGADAVRDDDLLVAAADGDPDAWDLLVDRILPHVWRAALDAGLGEPDAGDVCQLVCVRLAQSLHEIGPGGRVRHHVARISDEECRRAAARAARARAARRAEAGGLFAGCVVAAT